MLLYSVEGKAPVLVSAAEHSYAGSNQQVGSLGLCGDDLGSCALCVWLSRVSDHCCYELLVSES